MSAQTDLADRYGADAPWRRRTLLLACVVVAAAFLGWLGWAIWDQSTPEVESRQLGYDVVDEHRATSTIQVSLADADIVASCTLRAYAEDHSVVGELVFEPTDGRSTQTVRTERLATSVQLLGCTTADQNRPR